MSSESFWRKVGESWHFGAGQDVFDREDSSAFRFRTSQGMDVWTRWQLKLLPQVDLKRSSANSNLIFAVVGDYLYIIDGAEIRRTQDITVDTPTFTNVTGVPATAPTHIATDGFNVLTSHGSDGIYKTTRGAATTASHITGAVAGIAFAKNRFMAWNNGILYDVTTLAMGGAPGALPAAFFTHPNTDFDWVDMAEGDVAIYAAGVSGDKSIIYRIGLNPDGTALDAPVVAGRLEDGEIVTSIDGYLGRFVFIGSNKGFRLAVAKENGDLTIGARIDTTTSVQCFEGQGEFVWFGWTNFSLTATGLGRLSLRYLTDLDLLVPAYASDLMVRNINGAVRSVVTFQDLRLFSVAGSGFYGQDDELEADGFLDTGEITYGLTDKKIGLNVDAQHTGGGGEHEIFLSVEGETFTSLGIHEPHLFPRTLGAVEGRYFELRHKLYRDDVVLTLGPELHSWMITVQVVPSSPSFYIYATILLGPSIESSIETTLVYDPFETLSFIHNLWQSRAVTTWQIGRKAYTVVVEDYQVLMRSVLAEQQGLRGFESSVPLKMKVVA